MKKQIKISAIIMTVLATALFLNFTSCKKGDTGPAGAKGDPGKNGISNITTYTANVTSANWVLNSPDYETTLLTPNLNSSIVNGGAVMVYIGNNTSTSWSALPFSYQTVQFSYTYSLGQVLISVGLSNGSVVSNPGNCTFKIVIIPFDYLKPNVNINNYNEVKKAYNLN